MRMTKWVLALLVTLRFDRLVVQLAFGAELQGHLPTQEPSSTVLAATLGTQRGFSLALNSSAALGYAF